MAVVYSIGSARTRAGSLRALATTGLRAVAGQRGHLLPWAPVCLGAGIGAWFALPVEPGAVAYALLAGLVALAAAGAHRLPEDARPLAGALALVALGALLVGGRAQLLAAPVLEFRYYGPVEGRVVKIDRSASDALRLTLDRVVLRGVAPERVPRRVRVSVHGAQGFVRPEPGLVVIMTASLAPPPGPVEPGGFDFRRKAWFEQLGAVGYTRLPVLALAPPEEGPALWQERLRARISAGVQARLAGETGAFAAAITTGDRSAVGRETLSALRESNLAHLLAISGLHMGLITGFVFAALRYGLALAPALALRLPVRKLAAVGALLVGAGYLALSGGNVATERAFIMVAVMFGAVLVERRAVTLRAVAVAALIVLALRPESLVSPGFQMSFAATTALVAVFGAIRGRWPGWLARWLRPAAAAVISSAVAGLATAPVAAAFFNRIADYGLLANLLAVPLMGLVVMPGAVLAAVLWPLGLEEVGLAMMAPAIRWILGVADWVAGLEGAVTPVPAPGAAVLPVLALGALWLILWQGRARMAGVVPMALAFALWAGGERPPLLISDTGGLVGLMGEAGRALSKPRGEGFVAANWLENDGDAAGQAEAFERPGFTGKPGALRFSLGGVRLAHLTGRGAAGRVARACQWADWVIVSAPAPPQPGCRVLDRPALARSGAVALWPRQGGGIAMISSAERAGRRLWAVPALRRPR